LTGPFSLSSRPRPRSCSLFFLRVGSIHAASSSFGKLGKTRGAQCGVGVTLWSISYIKKAKVCKTADLHFRVRPKSPPMAEGTITASTDSSVVFRP
jgi:hypothetical protein